ncbi:MAG: PhoH family protein [Thermostichales cyanobacterium BF4_bins_65]
MSEHFTLILDSPSQALNLAGSQETNLKLLKRLCGGQLTLRGTEVWVQGTAQQCAQIRQCLESLKPLWAGGTMVTTTDVTMAFQAVVKARLGDYQQVQQTVLARTRKGQEIRPKTPHQQLYVEMIQKYDLVFGMGPAGTGKTYLATVMAVVALQERRFDKIILTRPAIEAGEKLGFLPGDLQDKVDPYLRPLYDAIYELIEPERVQALLAQQIIEVAPLAFMRGRTLSRAFVILDEAQNTTPEQMKMVLTRLGYGSRMVVTGDLTQTDLGSRQLSGLAVAEEILQGLEGVGFCYFDRGDIVRHPLVQRIVDAYTQYESSRS